MIVVVIVVWKFWVL